MSNTDNKASDIKINETFSKKDWHKIINTGEIYSCLDKSFVKEQLKYQKLMWKINKANPFKKKRKKLLKKFFGATNDVYIEPPFFANWGKNTYWGKNCYANFNLTLVDDGDIYIGDNVMIGPNVTITAAGHPFSSQLRKQGAQCSKKITIGSDVWIGANVIILPGISIGNNCVIGAGSIVTKNLPDNVLAFGNPAKIIKKLDN